MRAVAVSDPDDFLARTGGWLSMSEARHNLILGVAGAIASDRDRYPGWRMWLVERAGDPVAAAVMTPPRNLIVADATTEANDALAAAVAGGEAPVPGVIGNLPGVEGFITAWTTRTGVHAEITLRLGVFSAERVTPLPAPSGGQRQATAADRDLLVGWWQHFEEEALPDPPQVATDTGRNVDARLEGEASGIAVWEVDGQPVAMCGWGGFTPSGIRIGPVYTPPEHRGHGWATALVATVTERLLAGGRRFCFLYTDLANPTANDIYRRIGYHQVAESNEVAFR